MINLYHIILKTFFSESFTYINSNVNSACCISEYEGIHRRCSCNVHEHPWRDHGIFSTTAAPNSSTPRNFSTTATPNSSTITPGVDFASECKKLCNADDGCKGYLIRNYTHHVTHDYVKCELATTSECTNVTCTGPWNKGNIGILDPSIKCASNGGSGRWGSGCFVKIKSKTQH